MTTHIIFCKLPSAFTDTLAALTNWKCTLASEALNRGGTVSDAESPPHFTTFQVSGGRWHLEAEQENTDFFLSMHERSKFNKIESLPFKKAVY